jgi:hypothetical protein
VPLLRDPGALHRLHGLVEPVDDRRWRPAGFERGRVDERLEGRPRLAVRLHRAVEVAVLEAATTDERANLARIHVQRHERRLQRVGTGRCERTPPFDLLQGALDFGFGGALQSGVIGRKHPQPPGIDTVEPEAGHQLASNLLLEIGPVRLVASEAIGEVDALLAGAFGLLAGQGAGIDHRRQHHRPACQRPVEIYGGRPGRWRLHQARKQCGFAHGELGRRLSEVAARGGLGAIEPVAEVDLVEIQLEDLVFRIARFQLRGQDHFLELALERLVERQKALSRQLLGDRAAPLGAAALSEVGDHRSADADDVDAAVVVEPLVLDGQNGADQIRRDLIERHFYPLLLEDRERRPPVGIEHGRRLGHVADRAQALPRGELGQEIPAEPSNRRHGQAAGRHEAGGKRADEGRAGGQPRGDRVTRVANAAQDSSGDRSVGVFGHGGGSRWGARRRV